MNEQKGDGMLKAPVFVFTIPKSGTHLIANLFRSVIGADLVHPTLINEDYLLSNLSSLEPRVYVGHVRHSLGLATALGGARVALLCRDPRDVVTSYCNSLYHSRILPETLTDAINRRGLGFSDTLSFLILGGRFESTEQLDIRALCSTYYLGWLHRAATTVRYEDLLPEGDDWTRPAATMGELLSALSVPVSCPTLEDRVREGSDPARSLTFHAGRAGAWRKFFTGAHITQFKAVAADLLVALEYEADNLWGDQGNSSRRAAPPPQPVAAPETIIAPASPAVQTFDADIYGRLESMAGALSQLENRKDYIHNKISFLKLPYIDAALLCHTNDSLHRQLNQSFTDHAEYRNYMAEARLHPDPEWVRERIATPRWQPLHDVLAPRLASGHRVCYLDIGCCYGMEPVLLSSTFWACRDRFRIVAVDPGPGGKLAPFNARMNGHGTRIQFMPLAVDSHTRTSLLYGEYGYLENVRTVNRFEASETFSQPCDAVSIDQLVEDAGIGEELVMKIDIQGGEADALRGGQRTLLNQCSAIMLKFIPHALAPTIDPCRVLSLIPDVREVYRVPYYWLIDEESRPWQRIDLAEMDAFTKQVWNSKEDYCFLLVLTGKYFATGRRGFFRRKTPVALPTPG